jgi:hypothetical protein
MLRLQHAGKDLRHQAVPDFDVLPVHQHDLEVVGWTAPAGQLLGAADAGMAAAEDDDLARTTHHRNARRSAVCAPK